MDSSIASVFHALGLDNYLPVALAFHTLASALDAAIPQPAPGSHWLPLRKAVSILALNFGNAANTNQPPLVTWLQRIVMVASAIVPPPGNTAPVQPTQPPLEPAHPDSVIVIPPRPSALTPPTQESR